MLSSIDIITILYALVSLLLVLFHFGFQLPYSVIVLVGTAIVTFMAPAVRRQGSGGRFGGEFYPVLLTIALYTEVGLYNLKGGISHDLLIAKWEFLIFSGQPSLQWSTAWPNPILSSILHLSYFSYYMIVLGIPLALWFSGRRDSAVRTILLMMITFYICYTWFRLFPVAGPRFLHSLPDNAAMRTPVALFVHKLVSGGSAWGTAFPSSHVAVAFVNAGTAFRCWRRLGMIAWIMAVLLAFSTVYGQFHYAIDAVAGALLGIVILLLARVFSRIADVGAPAL